MCIMGVDLSFLPAVCLPASPLMNLAERLLYHCIPYSVVSCQLKEVKKVHQLAHTYRNNFYHVPHYPERACLIDMFAKGLAIEPSGSELMMN